LRRGKPCRYEPATDQPSGTGAGADDSPQPDADVPLLSTSIKGHLLRALAKADDLDPDLAEFAPAIRLHALESLNHFVTCDLSWLKARKVQTLMQHPATALVIDHQYLLHAVLAISSAHLATLKPDTKSYLTAARLHWQHSMHLFSRCFQICFNTQDVDAIYFASQLHAILAFLFVRLPLDQSGQRMANWLVAMRYKHVLFNTPAVVSRLRLGLWEPLVKSHDSWLEISRKRLAETARSPTSTALLVLMQYSDALSSRTWFHEERLQYAAMLEGIPSTNDTMGAFLSFITEAPEEYIASLQSGDTFSLLLLLHWTVMVSKIGQWWLAEAADAERRSLLAYLSRGADDKMKAVLDVLINEQDTT
jgi:hypothetical protein